MKGKRKTARRRYGDGEIRQRSDGSYVARVSLGFDENGVRRREEVEADSPEHLRLKIANLRAKKTPRYYTDAQRITLGAFLSEWLDEKVKREKRRATYVLREATCRNHITPYLGTIKLSNLEPSHVKGLFKTLGDLDIGIRTQQVVHATLRAALSVAVEDELLERNVVAIVKRPRVKDDEQHEKIILDEAQAKKLLRSVRGDEYEALYVLALTTGCRQGELFALEWRDVHFDKKAMRIEATLTENEHGKLVRTLPKTKKSRRIVDLPEIALAALREHRRKTGGFEGIVFRDSAGGPIRKSNFLRRHFHPLLKRAGLPRITFHSLRHVANSLLYAKGVNIHVLADRLGHSTTRTTADHYTHVMVGAQRAAANEVDSIFGT